MSPVSIPVKSGSGPYVEDVSCNGASRNINLSTVPRASQNANVYLFSWPLSNGHDTVTLCFLVTFFPRVTLLLGAGGENRQECSVLHKTIAVW